MGWADRIIARLESGESVTFRPRGNSMTPIVRDGQEVTVDPVGGYEPVPGDVVLCTVQGRQYLHLVDALLPDGRVQIANAKGRVNGRTRRVHGVMRRESEMTV